MAKNNNVFEEIQELVRQIETNYQEGVDFEEVIIKDKNCKVGHLKIISSRLKEFCRSRFNFPLGVDDYLDYTKEEKGEASRFFYRTSREGRHDYFVLSMDGRPWEYFFSSQKQFEEWRKKNPDNRWDSPEEKKPENCSVCGKLTLLKDGRMRLWNDECRIIGVNEDGYSMKLSKPFALAHFHPECAKKYHFANNGSQPVSPATKEKILRNLDKISFDQAGHLANAELLKNPHCYGTARKRELGIYLYQTKIEDEEINLLKFDREENKKDYLEIRNAIVNNIKQNILDWEIKKDEYNNDFLENRKTGAKVWIIIFDELVFENGKKDWTEIEILLKNDKINREQIRQFFQQHNIKKIKLVNGELVIECNDKETKKETIDNQLLQTIKNYSQKHNKEEITWDELNVKSNNNSTNINNTKSSQFENKYLWLTGGITLGVTISALIVFYRRRKTHKN